MKIIILIIYCKNDYVNIVKKLYVNIFLSDPTLLKFQYDNFLTIL